MEGRLCACDAPLLYGCVIIYIYTVYYAYRASYQATYSLTARRERHRLRVVGVG